MGLHSAKYGSTESSCSLWASAICRPPSASHAPVHGGKDEHRINPGFGGSSSGLALSMGTLCTYARHTLRLPAMHALLCGSRHTLVITPRFVTTFGPVGLSREKRDASKKDLRWRIPYMILLEEREHAFDAAMQCRLHEHSIAGAFYPCGGGLLLASAPALCRETLDGSVSKRFILLALLRICEMSDFSLVIGCKLQNCSSRRIQLCWFGSRLLAVTCASFLLRSMHNELLPRSLDILR